MEKGSYNSESGLPRPDDDSETSGADKDKKKKRKATSTDSTKTDASDKGRESDGAVESENKGESKHAPDSFGALLERMTRDLKPEDKAEERGSGLAKLFQGEKQTEEHSKQETTEASDKSREDHEVQDPSLEQLTDNERREAAEVYIDDRQRDVAEEIESSEPKSAKAESAHAVEEFLEATRAKLKSPDHTVDNAVDESFAETAQKYAPEAMAVLAAEEKQDVVLPEEAKSAEEQSAETVVPGEGELIEEVDRSDVEHAMEYEDFVSPVADLPPVMIAGDANQLPVSTTEETSDTWGAPYELYDNPLQQGHEHLPEPTEAITMPMTSVYRAPEQTPARAEDEVPSVPVGTALIVGFAAYLFGRRRGRIKTEQRLLPIQKSLEQEVRTIHEKLAAQETQLRQLVHRQSEMRAPTLASIERTTVGQQPLTEMTPATHIERPVAAGGVAATLERPAVVAAAPEKPNRPNVPHPESPRHPSTPSSRPEFAMPLQAAEAFIPSMAASQSERTGTFMSYSPEVSRFETPKPELANLPVEVALMPQDVLVKAADEIVVGAATMRQVFETNLISERGLRRIVAEYRRGGDVRAILAEELMIKEMGYERDPRVRDHPLAQQQIPRPAAGGEVSSGVGGGTSVPGTLATSSPAIAAGATPGQAPINPPSSPSSSPVWPYQPGASTPTPSKPLVIANIVAVGILIALLAILLILHI